MPTPPGRSLAATAVVLQVSPAPAEPLALLGTFLVGWAFFAFTAQIAASFVLADPPWRRAIVVGAPISAVSTALIQFDPAVAVAAGLVVDAAAIHLLYERRPRTTALMVALHYAASLAIVLALSTLIALLSTAPG